jgi:hypothetical protein
MKPRCCRRRAWQWWGIGKCHRERPRREAALLEIISVGNECRMDHAAQESAGIELSGVED